MVRPRQSERKIDLPKAIKAAAWQLVADQGVAALSLRAIARELKITAPAIYTYFSSRDELVTALIVDAFLSLGQRQATVLIRRPQIAPSPEEFFDRLTDLGTAYRIWAIEHAQRYQLIFGTPLPGYHAPREVTVPAAAAALQPMINTLQAAWESGALQTYASAPMTTAIHKMFSDWSDFACGAHPEALYAAFIIWTRVHGFVSLEIGGQLPSFLVNPEEIYLRELQAICRQFIRIP